jgi:DivIVA domain-containing protein
VFVLMVAVVAVVVFGVAAVAAGDGGTLEPPVRDLPGPPVDPGTADLAELSNARFPAVLRGYRMDAVDAVLDRVAGELAARDARIAALTEELATVRSQSGGEF